MAADRFLKEFRFDEARREIEKAKELDPTNMYVHAFLDRINYFEQQRKKEAITSEPASPKAPAAPKITPPPPKSIVPVQPQSTAPPPPRPAPPPSQAPPYVAPQASPPQYTTPPPVQPAPSPQPAQYAPPPKPEQYAPPPQPAQYAPPPQSAQYVPPDPYAESDPYSQPSGYEPPVPSQSSLSYAPPAPSLRRPPSSHSPQYVPIDAAAPPQPPYTREEQPVPPPAANETGSQLEQMRRQIELLTQALEQEKVAREEIKQQQIQGAVTQFRQKLERAWANGAPPENEVDELHRLAETLQIPESVEQAVMREVKLDTYSRAVKEVIAKRQLLRSSSSTLEWLRKVYQVTLEEYLEYESKFLLDLVADQYKGTLVQISRDDSILRDITPKLKSSGFAVVASKSPEEALEKIEKINPNLILCDTEFGPQALSGIRFLHVIRNNSKFSALPFILVCQASEVEQLQSSELRPNEAFIQKPVNFDELTALMNKKLAQYREYIGSLS
jgi:ActR/RegA family two-component response regulator